MSKNICLFGDSITWGDADYEAGGWGARLQKFFYEHNYDISVYNCGVSGDDTRWLLQRFKVESVAREPDIIIFAIGINDSTLKIGVPADEFRGNLIQLISEAREYTDNIIFLGLTPIDEKQTQPVPWERDIFYSQERVEQYDDVIKKVCEKNNLPFVNIIDLLELNDLEDGLHPNSRGHEKIFKEVKKFLIEQKLI